MREPHEVRVIAAVVEDGGRWLLGRRPAEKRHAGLWEFPGGKLLDGESASDAARRELAEELDLAVKAAGRTLFTARDPASPFVIEFVEIFVEGSPTPHEHDELGWFDVEALRELPLAPADRAFATWLAARHDDSV